MQGLALGLTGIGWRPAGAGALPPRRALVRSCGADGIASASALLAQYDRGHRAAAASEGAVGFGGAQTANEYALATDGAPLAAAVRLLSDAAASQQPTGRLMIGICADDAAEGISTLKAWVTALGLPKGPLHGMDKDGVPLDMSTFGAVYIKYSSLPFSNTNDPPGSAMLSGYTGEFRGIYFNPSLEDGRFRQYAVLPLGLFSGAAPVELAAAAAAAPPPDSAAPAAARAVSDASAGSNTRAGGSVGQQRKAAAAASGALTEAAATDQILQPLLRELSPLGISLALEEVTADGGLRLRYAGPSKAKAAVAFRVRDDRRVSRVEWVEEGEEEDTA